MIRTATLWVLLVSSALAQSKTTDLCSPPPGSRRQRRTDAGCKLRLERRGGD